MYQQKKMKQNTATALCLLVCLFTVSLNLNLCPAEEIRAAENSKTGLLKDAVLLDTVSLAVDLQEENTNIFAAVIEEKLVSGGEEIAEAKAAEEMKEKAEAEANAEAEEIAAGAAKAAEAAAEAEAKAPEYVVSVTDDEIDEMARIVWLEVGQSQYYTQYLTACVMVNRLLDWGYSSMTEVIFAKNQYSTANKYTNWGGGTLTVSDTAYEAVYEALTDPDRNVHYQDSMSSNNGKTLYWQDPTSGAKIYY